MIGHMTELMIDHMSVRMTNHMIEPMIDHMIDLAVIPATGVWSTRIPDLKISTQPVQAADI